MITLCLNALNHHHRLVIALSSPPIIMHGTIKCRGLWGLDGRLIMNDEWWKVVNDQWHEQVITTYACNTMKSIQSSMLHITFFTKHFVLISLYFIFFFLCLWHTQALCAFIFFLLGLRPYYFFFFFFFSFSWPLATFLFFFLSSTSRPYTFFTHVACF